VFEKEVFMKTKIARVRVRSLLGASLSAAVLLTSKHGLAQESINLPQPNQAVALGCVAVTAGDYPQVQLRRNFVDAFDKLDLKSNRWTPHYDAGYDDTAKRWLGYDWVVKRTLPGAQEQQIYVDPDYRGSTSAPLNLNPFTTSNGILTITADRIPPELKAALPGFQFMSGLLTTRKSFLQKYGYFEIRAKVPAGRNLLPAFWLLPFDKSWPPELDVFEAPGHEPDKIVTTVHWKEPSGQQKASGCRTVVPGFDKQFHRYGALWTPERVVYYLDRRPIAQIATPPGFDKPMYMIVNLAVGGTWVGRATDENPMPVKFEVDEISAYTLGEPDQCNVAANGVKTCQGN
jgi:beta-glucanase (GH16 family)